MSTVLISTHLYEKRPLKKPKLGPPDVYPQDPKQKEDELTPTNVKQGYSNSTLLQDEYGTARNANITSGKFGEFFSSILAKKHELNTFSDTSKKKHVLNKDSAIHVTAKTKNYVEGWFKDLASNTKSLAHLSKKVPFFNKKEEIFVMLYEYSVPMLKAQWFLKLSNAQQMAMSESNNKSKKRQMPDPSQEWTFSLCKFLKDHYLKIMESLNPNMNNSNNSNFTTNLLNQPPVKIKELLNQWLYYTQMARFLYEEGLLDRHDFLIWMLELFEKIKSIDDPMLNLLAPMLVQYVDEFTQSESLSRHLAFHCAKKISQLVDHCSEPIIISNNDSVKENNNNDKSNAIAKSLSSSSLIDNQSNGRNLSTCFKEIISCSKYQELLFALSTVIQVITLDCPTAMVWHNFDNSTFLDSSSNTSKASLLHGSPLDYLPCEPSNLPIPSSENAEYLKNKLRNQENLIRHRSANCEKKWFYKTFELATAPQSAGNVVDRLLDVLDCLDKHLFDKISSSNSLDTLYNKIFNINVHMDESNSGHHSSHGHSFANKSIAEIVSDDVAIVKLLCEWAVTTKRLGEYRSRVVAKLLERRQNEILNEKENASTINENNNDKIVENKFTDVDDKEWNNINNNILNDDGTKNSSTIENDNIPIYQRILFEFLDLYAPVTEDKTLGIFFPTNTFANNCQADNKQAFNNLVLLFSELIRHDVFSHDIYMCTLISRGHFVNPPNISLVASANSNHQIKNNNEDSLTGLLPSNIESVSNGCLMNPIHKSTSSSSLPMFDPLSNNSNLNGNEMQLGSNMFGMNDNLDEDKLDEDLDKLLQNIKAGQQSKDDQNDILLPDAMESDKEDDNVNEPNSVNTNSTSLSDLTGGNKNQLSEQISPTARHLLYTLHFPLPQDEPFNNHECNQRHILLYGVGKTKDEAKHIVRKTTKEIQKLFNRKTSMDISDGGKVKKHIIKEGFNFEMASAKFQNLSIFDQQVVTSTCAQGVLEMLNGVVLGNANHLPLIESIAFLFDLMEIALNVNGLVEFIVQILKELVEVEQVLQQKCSILARPYCTSIGLYIVGVLNRYHSYVVASIEDIVPIFEGLLKLVRHVKATDCSSAERCIFFYLDDLNSSCSNLLKKYQEIMSQITSNIKMMMMMHDDLTMDTFNTQSIMMQYLKNPRLKVDSIHIRQLNENASDRHSLVFNAIRCIAEADDMDYLNELSVLCAELTAACFQLSNEWYSAFQALCNPNCKNEYITLLQINIGDRTIYDNLAVFVSILVARRCFGLEDLIYRVFLPSLLKPTVENDDETERKARLCCHLILYLFKYYDSPLAASNSAMNSSFASSSRYSLTSPGPLGLSTVAPTLSSGPKSPFIIKYACDRYLLGGALNSLNLEYILTLLKAIFVLGTQEKKGEKSFKSEKTEFESIYKPMSNEDDFGDRTYISQMTKTKDSTEKPPLSDYAKYILRQVCLQDWVHDRCLRGFMINPNVRKLLFYKKMSYKDSQCLFNMICYHKQILPASANINEKIDPKQIQHIFQNLDEWSLRISWLQLQINYENLTANSASSDLNAWHETLATTIVDYFKQLCQTEPVLNSKNLTMFTSKSSTIKNNILGGNFGGNNSNERIWLLKPLIAKLPIQLQGRIIRITAQNNFDQCHWINYSPGSGSLGSKSKSGFQGFKNTSNMAGITLNNQNVTSALISYQPFVSLLLMCLNSKEDHKEYALKSMQIQLSHCINEKLSDDIRAKNLIQEGLQLRLSLLGANFDCIKSSSSMTGEWVTLLAQLISFTIVDPHINYVNFSTVLDMLTSLMHHSLGSNLQPEQREESKKLNQNLIRKLKKELNIERIGLGVRMARQLLPLTKHQAEVITCEAMGSLVDTKGNKIAGFDSIDKKQGFQAAEKQKLSPWDLIEGHKNSAPLSWTWFGAIKMERKPLRMEENFVLLARHDHSICEPISYYLEPPPVPPEDEPPQQQVQQAQIPLMSQHDPNNNLAQTNSTMPGYQTNPVLAPNMPPNPMSVQGSTPNVQPCNNMQPSQSMNPTFNPINTMHHSIHQPPPPPSGPNMGPGFQYHLPMNPNNIPPTPTGPPNVMHSPNVMVPTQHMMNANNEPPPQPRMPPSHMNQPHHPGMMNSMSNPSMMPMHMDMMDMAPTHTPTGPMPGLRVQKPSGPSMQQMPPMPNVNVNTRGQAPKKPKAVRKRRTTKAQAAANNAAAAAAVNVNPMQPVQANSSIRMANSFDNYNSNPVNNPNTGNAWPQYQHNNQSQPNNIPSNNQQFYHPNAGQNPNSNQSMVLNQQSQQPRFQEQMLQQNTSKVRLRAMLNTRHPNSNQFNLNQNESPVTNPVMNSNSLVNNQPSSGSMIFQQTRHPMPPQMMQPKNQIRSQGQNNQNQMFQQQQMGQGNSGAMHHHIGGTQQPTNFGSQQNAPPPFNNMQSMDNSMVSMSSNPNYQQPQPPNTNQQPNMMMRPQMQPLNSQQSNQGQFMQQRSQFSNFGNHQSQQQQQASPMLNNGQHWSQNNQMGPNHRAPMTQLQRQLSAPNQGSLPGSQTPYPY